ncbi:MAG: hypothetical protein HZY79_15265 [Rhodoblastus sp.]|nr:MAG: hypothetical protein HZY79_15265 [Rhodoblastus sp.]
MPSSIRAEGPLERQDRDFVMKTLRMMVWAGFDTRKDILAAALGGLTEGEDAPHEAKLWIAAQLDQMIAEKKSAETAWPALVEYDRLEAAFDALNDQGVVAAPAAGYSLDEARAEAWADYADAKVRRAPSPASLSTLSPTSSALDGGPFRVSTQVAVRGDEEDLAARVARALSAAGFRSSRKVAAVCVCAISSGASAALLRLAPLRPSRCLRA